MFFAKDDIIELKEKNFLVEKVALIENEAYYEVNETSKENDEALGNKLIIRGINESGTLYIEEVLDKELLTQIKQHLA